MTADVRDDDFHEQLKAILPRLRIYALSLTRDRDAADTARSFALFNAWSPPFRRVIDAAGGPPGPIDGRSIKEPADA